jgi:hypothetical protein
MVEVEGNQLWGYSCYVGNSLMLKCNARVGNIVVNNFM